jgi:hypothetical protein
LRRDVPSSEPKDDFVAKRSKQANEEAEALHREWQEKIKANPLIDMSEYIKAEEDIIQRMVDDFIAHTRAKKDTSYAISKLGDDW